MKNKTKDPQIRDKPMQEKSGGPWGAGVR